MELQGLRVVPVQGCAVRVEEPVVVSVPPRRRRERFSVRVVVDNGKPRARRPVREPRLPWDEAVRVERQLRVLQSDKGVLEVDVDGNAKVELFLDGVADEAAGGVHAEPLSRGQFHRARRNGVGTLAHGCLRFESCRSFTFAGVSQLVLWVLCMSCSLRPPEVGTIPTPIFPRDKLMTGARTEVEG